MARCRESYFKEIDIIEHIMQFREVKAELALRARRITPKGGINKNDPENKADNEARGSFF